MAVNNETTQYRKYFTLEDGRKISYLDYDNASTQTLVCVHGLTRNATDYHFFAKKIESEYRVISIDVAGRGFSDNLAKLEDYTYYNHLQDIIKLIDHLKLKNITWFGTSMGGILGIMLTSKRPNLIKKLILNDIGPIVPIDVTIRIIDYLLKVPESFDSREEISKKIKDIFCLFGMNTEIEWNFFIENSIFELNGKWYLQYDKKLIKNFKPDDKFDKYLRVEGMWSEWREINIPILLIWGKLSSTLRNVTIDKMSENKNLTRISVEGAGHTPHLMNENLNNLIFRWLQNQLYEDTEISFKKS